jgi:hypothetical protein
MAAALIDTADVDAVIGEDVRQRLFTDSADDGAYNGTKFTRAVNLASAMANAALENAGYPVGDSTTNDTVKLLTLSIFVRMAYARKQQAPPEDVVALLGGLPEGVRAGDVPVPGLSPDAQDAVGGVKFSGSTTTTVGDKPQIFGGLRTLY